MAINRALMNRQMYNMGGSSLQTGAPDITLTGDMRPTYSAMRKQRMAFGGVAGADGRRKYGLGSLLQKAKDKLIDDIIPNEIKENPMITALGGAALVNQFGIPKSIADYIGTGTGKNFIGNLLSNVVPGNAQFNTVIGDTDPFIIGGGYGGMTDDAGLPENWKEILGGQVSQEGGITNAVKNYLGNIGIPGFTGSGTGPDTTNMTDVQRNQLAIEQYKRRNLQADLAKALAAGSAAGAYVESQPKDTLPTDTTGVNFQTAQQAIDDPNLRFKPPLEATQLAADGGRIGYDMGGGVDELPYARDVMPSEPDNASILNNFLDSQDGRFYVREQIKQGKSLQQIINDLSGRIIGMDSNFTKQLPERAIGMDPGFTRQLPERTIDIDPDFEIQLRSGGAQGGRVPAQEGGLMDLGGMEKDYREEGGFVPIGGKEKADDVPARLSKNEFVFTADAVRNAGGGDIDEGAAIMERMMKNLEQGGKVSEESQGLAGAREMFETSQRLEKRII